MPTQVSFTAEKELKQRALKKAKGEGITLKAFLTYAMKAFVEGRILLTLDIPESEVEEINFTDKTLQKKAMKLAQLLK